MAPSKAALNTPLIIRTSLRMSKYPFAGIRPMMIEREPGANHDVAPKS